MWGFGACADARLWESFDLRSRNVDPPPARRGRELQIPRQIGKLLDFTGQDSGFGCSVFAHGLGRLPLSGLSGMGFVDAHDFTFADQAAREARSATLLGDRAAPTEAAPGVTAVVSVRGRCEQVSGSRISYHGFSIQRCPCSFVL
jgi:hypothetical protein